MRKWVLLIIPVFLLLILFIYPVFLRSAPSIKFDANYCGVVGEGGGRVEIECSPAVLYTKDGLFLGVLPEKGGFNVVRLELSSGDSILIALFRDDGNPRIEIVLPPGRDYGGRRVSGWTLNYVVYEYIADRDRFVYGRSKSLTLKEDYPPSGWVVQLSQNQYPVFVQLYPSLESPSPQSQKPVWDRVKEWWDRFNELLNSVVQGLQAGLSIFTNALLFLLNILQYLPLIIPVHIIGAFIDSPERGLSAINFYISLGRKLIDLVIKVVHVLVSLFDAITPLT